ENSREIRGVSLERLPIDTLTAAIQPATVPAQIARRITKAATCAKGRPGRFAALLWGELDMDESVDTIRPLRAAEPAVQYAVDGVASVPIERPVGASEWPAPGELAVLRKRLHGAVALIATGRHVVADRTLRQIRSALTRRHDWEHAAQASIALATSLIT